MKATNEKISNKEYLTFKNNCKLIKSFFKVQKQLIDQPDIFSGKKKEKIIQQLMKINRHIISALMSSQANDYPQQDFISEITLEPLELDKKPEPEDQPANQDNQFFTGIKRKIKEKINQLTGTALEQIDNETHFYTDLGFNSISVLQLFNEILTDFPQLKEAGINFEEANNIRQIMQQIEALAQKDCSQNRKKNRPTAPSLSGK